MWRLSTRFRSVLMGILDHFFLKHICEVRHWRWMRRPGLQSLYYSSQKCSIGLKSGHQTCSSMSLWTWLCALVPTISWYAEALRVPFPGTKGPTLAPEKQPCSLTLNFTLGIMQLDKYHSCGNHHTRLIHQIDRWRSTIRHSRERESRGGVLDTTASNALLCTWIQLSSHRNY